MIDHRSLIREATVHDVYRVANRLRPADKVEITASGWSNPVIGVIASYHASDVCLAISTPDAILQAEILLGVSPSPTYENMGLIWMVSSPVIEVHARRFLRHCHEEMYRLEMDYDGWYNYTHVDNTLHHRWLKWMGFSFLQKVEGPSGQFLEFTKLIERQ